MMIGRKNMFKYVLYMNGFVLLVCAGAIFGLFLLSQFAVYFSRSFSLSFIFFFIGIFLLFLAVFYLLSVVRMKQTMVALRILAFVLLAYTVLVIISFSIFIALLSTIENEYFISTFLTLCPIDVGGCMGDGCPFSPRHIPNAQTRLGCYKSFYETAGILNCSKDEIVMYGQTGVRCSTETILEKALETAKEDTLFIFKINSGACFASVINCAFTAHIILLFLYPSYMNFSKMSFCGLMDYIKRKSGADAAALAADKDLEALEHEDEDEYDSDEEEFMEKNAVKEKRALREEAENLRHIKNLLGYLGTSREDDDVYIKEPLEGITYHRPEVRVAAEHRRLMERQHAQQQQQLELQLTQQKKARLIAHKLSVHANASSSDEAKNTRAGGKLLAVSGSGQVRTGRAAKAKGTHRTKVADGAEGEGVADDNDEEIVEEDVKKKTKAKKGAVKKKKKGKTATLVHTGREDDASPSGAGASVSASGTSASPTAAPAHEHAHAHAHAHAHGHAHPHKSKTLQSPTHKTKPADGTKPG